jgi:N-acetylated-alpha-linked acidic dipeptidase
VTYAKEISTYLDTARKKAQDAGLSSLDFAPAYEAAGRMANAARKVETLEIAATGNQARLNSALRRTETAFISDAGLPDRPWYRHTIYAPGEFTGYSAVVIPGVNEAIDAHNPNLAAAQLTVLTQALDRAARTLESANIASATPLGR